MALPIRHPSGPVEATLDVAPMIDVLLVLLLASLLVQAFIRQRPSAGTPPVAATPAPISIDNPVVLDVTARGFLINGQPVPDAQLERQLRAIFVRRAAKMLFVRPAPERSSAQVAAVVRRARSADVGATALAPAGP